MRVSVISPHSRHTGNTTLAILIALELANNEVKTCITHTKSMSPEFYRYLNFRGIQDKTSTPSQIVKILRGGSLDNKDIVDYCKVVNDNLEAFTNNTENFDQKDMDFMVSYITNSFPHEHVVFDVSSNLTTIDTSDVIIFNITQSIEELKELKNYTEILKKENVVVVINKYNSIKSTLKEVAFWGDIKLKNNCTILHDNPWINWATNHGQLNILYKKIASKDERVIGIKEELNKICSLAFSINAKKPGRRVR